MRRFLVACIIAFALTCRAADAVVAIAGAANTRSGVVTSFTVAPDAACTADQLLFAFTSVNVGSATTVGVSGGTNPWNVITPAQLVEAGGNIYASWWHLCTGSEPANYTFTNNGANNQVAVLIRVSGASTLRPVCAPIFVPSNAASASIVATVIGPCAIVGSLPLYVFTNGLGGNFATVSAGWSVQTGTQPGNNPGFTGFKHAVTTDTTTTFALTATQTSDVYAYDGFFISPPFAAPPVPWIGAMR